MDKDKIIKISVIIIVFILCGCLYSCKDSEKTVVSLDQQAEVSMVETESSKSDIEANQESSSNDKKEAENETESKKLICVYICGEVQTPGVYQVEEGARMYQVVELAGGILETGAQNYLNLAESVTDGQKVVVPTIEEASQLVTIQEDNTMQEGSSSKYININTADEATLDSLPGIGASKAKSIISYRESNGGFKTIEELMQIEGIKEGVYNKIKDMITVK